MSETTLPASRTKTYAGVIPGRVSRVRSGLTVVVKGGDKWTCDVAEASWKVTPDGLLTIYAGEEPAAMFAADAWQSVHYAFKIVAE